ADGIPPLQNVARPAHWLEVHLSFRRDAGNTPARVQHLAVQCQPLYPEHTPWLVGDDRICYDGAAFVSVEHGVALLNVEVAVLLGGLVVPGITDFERVEPLPVYFLSQRHRETRRDKEQHDP